VVENPLILLFHIFFRESEKSSFKKNHERERPCNNQLPLMGTNQPNNQGSFGKCQSILLVHWPLRARTLLKIDVHWPPRARTSRSRSVKVHWPLRARTFRDRGRRSLATSRQNLSRSTFIGHLAPEPTSRSRTTFIGHFAPEPLGRGRSMFIGHLAPDDVLIR